MDLAKTVEERFDLLNEFEWRLKDLSARNVWSAEEDFYDIEDSHI